MRVEKETNIATYRGDPTKRNEYTLISDAQLKSIDAFYK